MLPATSFASRTSDQSPVRKRLLRPRAAALIAATLSLAYCAVAAAEVMRVVGEPAKFAAKTALDESFRASMASDAPVVTFFAVDPERIESAKRANVGTMKKAKQIGITQYTRDEAFDQSDVPLSWRSAAAGGLVAQFKVRTAGAMGVRVALTATGLPFGTEFRFAGSDVPSEVIHTAPLAEIANLTDDAKRYWSPLTEGDTQLIELHAPYATLASVPSGVVRVEAASHVFASARDGFKSASMPKGASLCSTDAICPTQTLGYVNARRAVAHMQFQANCGANGTLSTCICTGTLLNDTVPSTQVPYFYSANHCMSTQGQANTLTTYWNYENATCGGPDLPRAQSNAVQGGAQLLYADNNSDVLLLRLNGTPPSNAFFSGWDAAAISGGVNITVIHHPLGDQKKVTFGQTPTNPFIVLSDMGGTSYIVGAYSAGITEGGSSGSGILTTDASGAYFLRGGLLGGPSTCATQGNINNPSNRDYYSRFDQAFNNLKQWLAPEAASNGPLNYSDMWWAGQSENGWGMSVQQHSPSNAQFNAIYVYDGAGLPRWYVMPGGTWSNNFTVYTGLLYQPSGSPLNNYQASSLFVGNAVGTMTLTYNNLNSMTMQYTINNVSGTKNMVRQSFTGGTAPFNVGDMWWGGQSQNGWGINISQQGGTLFGVWYTYGLNGTATWFVMPGGSWSGNAYTGTMYSTLGSPWIGTIYNPNQLVVNTVGTLSFNFLDANNAIMNYTFTSGTFAGTSQGKQIVRQAF
jgi:hypothetical protein